MEWMHAIIKQIEPVQYAYGVIAVIGGMARYLNNYANGQSQFRLSIFAASAFVAGFSGWMFAIIGTSLNLPQGIVFVMAGIGGFSGEQTMKFLMEYVQNRLATK